jgi:putative phosphoesterase
MVYPKKKRHAIVHSDGNTEFNAIKTIMRPNVKRVGIIADTHIPDRSHNLHPKILETFSKVDLILHAGDITTPEVLETLGNLSETIAVRGNNRSDRTRFHPPLPEKVVIQIAEEYRLGLCHGLENTYQRIIDNIIGRMGFTKQCTSHLINRVRKFFNHVDLIIYGHGHWPMVYFEDPLLFINPGKAFGQKSSSCAVIKIQACQVRVKIFPLTPFKNSAYNQPEWRTFPILNEIDNKPK